MNSTTFDQVATVVAENRSMPNNTAKKLQNVASLSQLIRGFGACAVIASMSLFMLQGWSEGNDVSRYLKLLSQTGLLTAAGLILSFLVKEVKGARVFFGLSLVSVVANFTILGSLIYSVFALDGLLMDYPESMKWEVVNISQFIPIFIGAVALLSAVSFFAFSIFSRNISRPLTIGFLCLSSLLLVPLRSPVAAAALAAVALWGAWTLIQKLRLNDKVVLTNETKASFVLLLLPGALIFARAISFYNIDALAILAFCALGFAIARAASKLIESPNQWSRLLDGVRLLLGIVMSFQVADLLPYFLDDYRGFACAAVVIGFVFDQLIHSKDSTWKNWITNATVYLMVPITLLSAVLASPVIYSLQALAITIAIVVLSLFNAKQSDNTNASHPFAVIGVITATLIVLVDLVQLAQLGNWIIIGVAGAVLIVGASLYERFGLSLNPAK